MFTYFKKLLCKIGQKANMTILPNINPGEQWSLHIKSGDPWIQKSYRPVVILDVKNGWVRYDMGAEPFRDERKTIADFVGMYKLVTPNKEISINS